MASAGTGTATRSRRRSLDAEINLVPFIDLLSMCICFLLMTAVWIQVGVVQVKQSHGTEAPVPQAAKLDLDFRFLGPTSVELTFKRGAKVVKKQNVQGATLAELVSSLDSGLTNWPETATATAAAGGGDSRIGAAMIFPREGVSYGDMVTAMDILRKHRIINLGVVPAKGGV